MEQIDLVNSVLIALFEKILFRLLIFVNGIIDCDTYKAALFYLFQSSNPSLCSAVALSLPVLSIQQGKSSLMRRSLTSFFSLGQV